MHELQKLGLQRTVTFLDSIKCQYKLIDVEGNVYTNILEETSKKRSPPKYGHKELSNYIRPYIEKINIGDVVLIPNGRFDCNSIQSSATSMLCVTYGKGSYTSHKTETGLEIMRLF